MKRMMELYYEGMISKGEALAYLSDLLMQREKEAADKAMRDAGYAEFIPGELCPGVEGGYV